MLRMRRYAIGVAAALLLAQPVVSPVGATAPQYTIEDLGTIDGLVPTVTGVNAAGQVSGFVFTSTGSRAVRFVDPGGWSVRARSRVAAERRTGHQRLRRSDRLRRHVRRRLARLSLHRDDRSARVHPADGHRLLHGGHGINASGEVTGYGDTGDPEEGTRSFRALRRDFRRRSCRA